MPLLERESARASLAEYAAHARAGEGRLVFISGEAGVGKSAIVERLATDLPDARWAWGACDGLFTPRPLGPLFDLADQLGGELRERCREDAPRDELFRTLLREINLPGTLTVVVLEDLHWADEATIDLVRFVGRRLRGASVLLIATYRDEVLTASDPLRVALGELGTQRWTRRIGLAPLSAEAVKELSRGSGLEPSELFRLTSGNPFFVTEVIRAGIEARASDGAEARSRHGTASEPADAMPASARDAVLARVARLGPDARAVLDAAALIGTRFELGLLEAATPTDPSTLDELIASGLLNGDGGWLRFRHEIARIAVEQAIPAHRGRSLHAQILCALRAAGSPDDAGMAYHAEAAGDAPAVLEYAERAAGRAAELGSHRQAAAQYQRAIRFADGLAPAEIARLHDCLSDEFALIDQWRDAVAANERALELWRAAGDQRGEGGTMRRMSRSLWRECRGPESAAMAHAAVAALEPHGPSAELALAYAALAASLMTNDEDERAVAVARDAQQLAGQLGLVEVECDALNTEACSTENLGRDWQPTLESALRRAIAHDIHGQVGRAYANLHGNLIEERRFVAAEQYYVDGLAYCEDRGIYTFATCLRGGEVTLYEQTGRWDESVALAREVIGYVYASPINRVSPLLTLGLIGARRGEADCWGYLDESTRTADSTNEGQWMVPAHLGRAEAYWLEGKLDEARREIELAVKLSQRGARSSVRASAAIWQRRLGSIETTSGSTPTATSAAGGGDAYAEPYRLELKGDWSGAAAAWSELDCPYESALALLFTTDDAALRRALSLFDDLGAVAAARIARQRLRERGARSIPTGARATTRAHPLGLTRREREVLDLICAGRTNAEIATELFISAKTVDHHVSAVLGKLGTPTRNAAAAEAVRLGLVGLAEK